MHKAPDRGSRVIMKVAQRQLLRAAECAEKVRAILYDIFLLPSSHHLISALLKQGSLQASKIKFHKHSIGATPILAFGSLLLLATAQNNWVTDFPNRNSLDLKSRGVLQRLCHVARYYDRASQRLALTFGYGHSYQALVPAVLAEIKMMGGGPWPVILQ